MKNKATLSHYVVTAALIAAGYVTLTYLSAGMGLAYGNIQLRLSESLNILAVFTPAAVPGLTIGCLLGNISSPFGLIDIILGTAATFLSAVTIRLLSRLNFKALPLLCALPPTVFNAVSVGVQTVLFLNDGAKIGFWLTALQVAVGELIVCVGLGTALYYALKTKAKNLFL